MAKVAFLFPGQGAQYVGMAQRLCAEFAPARTLFESASRIVGYDLLDVCVNGPEQRLNSTVVSQPAIFVASWAALERLRHEKPDVVAACAGGAGLSLGEYTALAFAGAFRFEDGVRLVAERGRAMEDASQATPSGMCSLLGAELAQVESLCAQARGAGRIWVANLLCPGNTAVSGEKVALDRIESLAESGGARAVRLAVAGAFHTEIMRPADERLAAVLDAIPVQAPRLPVYSNVDGQPHVDSNGIRRRLVQQVISPVLWENSVRRMLADGFDAFYEIGPGRVLKGLLRRIERKVPCENVEA